MRGECLGQFDPGRQRAAITIVATQKNSLIGFQAHNAGLGQSTRGHKDSVAAIFRRDEPKSLVGIEKLHDAGDLVFFTFVPLKAFCALAMIVAVVERST